MIALGVGTPAPQDWDPDPNVVAKPTRRKFTAKYKFRVLEETDRFPCRGAVPRPLGRPNGRELYPIVTKSPDFGQPGILLLVCKSD